MKDIVSFLLDPNKCGIYHATVSVDLAILREFLKEILAFDKKSGTKSIDQYKILNRRIPRAPIVAKWAVEDLANAIDHLDIYKPKNGVLSGKILSALPLFLITTRESGIIRSYARRGAFFPGSLLKPNVAVLKTIDAMSITSSYHSPVFVLDICSVKKSGTDLFEKFVESIPIIGEKANITQRGKKHSSRYCYEPYPAAVMLWACSIVDKVVPDDILDYFDGSVRYWERNEWRISIILSAIAVESLLAEIYEEYFHELAPSDPLGALRDKIETKQKFPPKTREDINLVNQSRISAVHRSSMRVGEREARNALIGATRFTHWAFSKGPLST